MSKCREEFEKWALDMEIYLATDDDGNYVDYTASASWHAWQAARPSYRGEAVAGEVDEVLAAFSAATVTPDNRMYFNSGQDTTRMRKAIAALTDAIGRE